VQRGEAHRDRARLGEIIAPRGRLPDAVVLLANGHAVGHPGRVGAGELRKGVVLARRCVRRQVHSPPRVTRLGRELRRIGRARKWSEISQAAEGGQANRDVITNIYDTLWSVAHAAWRYLATLNITQPVTA